MKLKLTKYPKLNFLILKIIEVSLLCLVPFWMGKLSDWLYVQTDHYRLFVPAGNTLLDIWFNGLLFIAFFAAVIVLCMFLILGVYCLIQQNMKWAKRLAGEDKNETN